MRQTNCYCDRCGAEIKEGLPVLQGLKITRDDGHVVLKFDLCIDCLETAAGELAGIQTTCDWKYPQNPSMPHAPMSGTVDINPGMLDLDFGIEHY